MIRHLDLAWIDTLGHQQSGRRPAPVLTAKPYNTVARLCFVCPITFWVRGYPFEVAPPGGAALSGVVPAYQPRGVSWQKLRQTSGALLYDVRERLHVLLGTG